MAIRATTDTDTARAGADAPGAPTAAADAGRAPGLDRPSSLFGIMSLLGAGAALGQDIDKYIETIKSYFTKDTTNISRNIEIRRLAEPHGAHVFISGEYAFVMLFASLLQRDQQNFTPVSDRIKQAAQSIADMPGGSKLNLLSSIVLIPEDYDRAKNMALGISTIMQIANDQHIRGATASIMSDYEYKVDPNVLAARQFISDVSPHAVPPRVDIGFVLYANLPRRAMAGFGASQLDESKPIAAVGGYTEILRVIDPATNLIKYQPLIHITEIATLIPLPGIVPVCLAIAVDQFIAARTWINPFITFVRNKPSLGNLEIDPVDKTKLWWPQDRETLSKWMPNNMMPQQLLAIDVAEGRWRIPQLALYGYPGPESFARIYDQITAFFGTKIPVNRQLNPYDVKFTNYVGVYGDVHGRRTDSREIDYLNLVAQHGTQDDAARLLLEPYNPMLRAKIINDKVGNLETLFRTPISVIEGPLLSNLAAMVVSVLNISGTQNQDRMASTDWMRATAQGYAGQNFSVMRADTRGNWNYDPNYRV